MCIAHSHVYWEPPQRTNHQTNIDRMHRTIKRAEKKQYALHFSPKKTHTQN